MKVYELKRSDRRLLLLANAWMEEYGNFKRFGIDNNPIIIVATVLATMESGNGAVFVAENNKGELVGIMSCFLYDNTTSNGTAMNENIFYVMKKYRKIAGIKLLLKAIQWGVEMKCETIQVSASKVMEDTYDDAKKLYKRLGFEEYETIFVYKKG
jgi:hypothetical protein